MNVATHALALVLIGALVFVGGTGVAWAAGDPLEDVNDWYYPHAVVEGDDWEDYDGWTIQTGAAFYGVDDDEGRFREDRYTDDDVSGGIQRATYRDDNLEVIVRAVVEDVYGAEVHYEKPDEFRIDAEFTRYRKYYDGSNEAWNPRLYGLPAHFADWADENFYTDRVDINVEGTLLYPDLPNVTVGWHHWERFGDEVLLRGSRAMNTNFPNRARLRSIPAVARVDGKSDTIYVEVPFTLAETHNFSIRQEYEHYRDTQYIEYPRYRFPGGVAPGNIDQFRVFEDDPEWEEWRTLGHYDSFITDNFYINANYFHGIVENTTEREHLRLIQRDGTARNVVVNPDVDIDRDTDVLALSLVWLGIAEHGKLHTAFRVEHSDTDADSFALQGPSGGPPAPPATDPLIHATQREETRLGESAEFVWKGLQNTTLTVDAEWEQRYLETNELADVHTHELNTVFNPEFPAVNLIALDRHADINHLDQEYTFTAVNRPSRDVRVTGRYRFQHKERDYDEERDNLIFDATPLASTIAALSAAYPGRLGDSEQDVHEVTAKADWHFLPAWTGTLKYQYEMDQIEYDIQNTEGQDLDVHRVSGTVFGVPVAGCTLTGMAMFESYELDTPTVISPALVAAGVDWAPGTSLYDYEYESFILFGSCHYVFNEKWAGNLAYQHTENNGSDVNNGLDEVWVGANYTLAKDKIIQVKYEYFNFDDDLGNGFDDYDGHGVSLAFAYRF